MNTAKKLQRIAENEQRVFEAGENKGKELLKKRVSGTLTEITAKDLAGVTKIGQNSLSYLPLRTLTLPDGVTSIERNGISYCEYLKSIVLPEGVRTIAYGAFNGCWSLKSIELPSTVESIDSYAFNSGASCVIHIHADTPPVIQTNTFTADNLLEIRVPKGRGDAYRNATIWSAYADKIFEEETI